MYKRQELQQLLGAEDAARFCRWYGITAAGNFGGRSVPNLLHNRDWEQRPAAIEALRRALARIRPVRAGLHLSLIHILPTSPKAC